ALPIYGVDGNVQREDVAVRITIVDKHRNLQHAVVIGCRYDGSSAGDGIVCTTGNDQGEAARILVVGITNVEVFHGKLYRLLFIDADRLLSCNDRRVVHRVHRKLKIKHRAGVDTVADRDRYRKLSVVVRRRRNHRTAPRIVGAVLHGYLEPRSVIRVFNDEMAHQDGKVIVLIDGHGRLPYDDGRVVDFVDGDRERTADLLRRC